MINKLTYLFLLVLCFGLTSVTNVVSAQTGADKILVAGKKPLKQSEVNQLIKFYEWAFEASFSDSQRERIQMLTENDYRQNTAESRRHVDEVLNGMKQIFASNEEVQREARKIFVKEFVAALRNDADSESSQFFLSVYEGSRGEDNSTATANDSNKNEKSDDADNSTAGNVGSVAQLAGKWVWSRTGGTSWNTNGVYAGGSGSRFTYQFSPNGTVEFTGIMNTMMGGCSQQVFNAKTGKASLSGSTLTIKWSPTKFTRDFSCDRANNYTKTLPADTETLQISFKESYGQRQLCLTGKDETCFSPAK